MNHLRRLLALAAAPAILFAVRAAADASPESGVVAETFAKIDPLKPSSEWKAVIAELAVTRPVESAFIENRYLSIRRTAVTLPGVMRSQPGVGVSISHTRNDAEDVVLVKTDGLYRREDGKFAKIPYDVPATRAPRVMLSAMAFDPEKIARDFEIDGHIGGDGWTLRLRPRDPDMAGAVSMMRLDGEKGRIRKITIYDGDRIRLEIFIHSVKFPKTFAPEILHNYFGA